MSRGFSTEEVIPIIFRQYIHIVEYKTVIVWIIAGLVEPDII